MQEGLVPGELRAHDAQLRGDAAWLRASGACTIDTEMQVDVGAVLKGCVALRWWAVGGCKDNDCTAPHLRGHMPLS